jgi:hypothetical protein
MSIVLAILLTAAEPCAWVMWVEYASLDGNKHERSIEATAAYGSNGAQECYADAETRAIRLVEDFRTAPNVKSVKRSSQMGGQELVKTELKKGGTLWRKYMCFPHPVKPE